MAVHLRTATIKSMQIKVDTLNKTFAGPREVLRTISFSVDSGEIVSLIGPSGCGKSTILRILAGLETATSGDTAMADRFSFVFQHPLLMEWRTVLDNTRLPLELMGISKKDSGDRARAALDMVGLSDAVSDFPDQLSGGMKMRVSLARALVTEPQVLLLDEPFAALDEITRERLNLEILKLRETRGISAIFVTHNVFEAVFMSDRILNLSMSPAEITEEIKVDLEHPRTAELKGTPQFAECVGRVQRAMRGNHE